VFKTEPVDPRDLMRGDYVRLRYEGISSVNGALLAGVWPEQDTVFCRLADPCARMRTDWARYGL
jgi:uncharacterized membrane-anchored protein